MYIRRWLACRVGRFGWVRLSPSDGAVVLLLPPLRHSVFLCNHVDQNCSQIGWGYGGGLNEDVQKEGRKECRNRISYIPDGRMRLPREGTGDKLRSTKTCFLHSNKQQQCQWSRCNFSIPRRCSGMSSLARC